MHCPRGSNEGVAIMSRSELLLGGLVFVAIAGVGVVVPNLHSPSLEPSLEEKQRFEQSLYTLPQGQAWRIGYTENTRGTAAAVDRVAWNIANQAIVANDMAMIRWLGDTDRMFDLPIYTRVYRIDQTWETGCWVAEIIILDGERKGRRAFVLNKCLLHE
jgi:hypothetical protein